MKELREYIVDARTKLMSEFVMGNRSNSKTWVMFEVMNVVRDEDLEKWGLDLVEVAEVIEAELEGAIY